MPALTAGIKREALFQEISNVLRRWPELEQKVFSQAHYDGQSLEVISRSLQLDVEEVTAILKECERRLYASLRSFRKNNCEKPSLSPTEIARLAACGQDLKGAHAFASRVSKILDASQMPV